MKQAGRDQNDAMARRGKPGIGKRRPLSMSRNALVRPTGSSPISRRDCAHISPGSAKIPNGWRDKSAAASSAARRSRAEPLQRRIRAPTNRRPSRRRLTPSESKTLALKPPERARGSGSFEPRASPARRLTPQSSALRSGVAAARRNRFAAAPRTLARLKTRCRG